MNKLFFATFLKRISLGWEEDFVFHYSTPTLLNFEGKVDLHGLWRRCVMEQDFFDSRPKILVSRCMCKPTSVSVKTTVRQEVFVLLLLACVMYFGSIKLTLSCYNKVSKAKKKKAAKDIARHETLDHFCSMSLFRCWLFPCPFHDFFPMVLQPCC